MLFWIAVILPLLGAAINGLVLRKMPKLVAHLTGSSVMLASFVCTVLEYYRFMVHGGEPLIYKGFDWLQAGSFNAPFTLCFDRLSGFMMLVVTGIGSLIHIYAGGYMHEEEKTYRFFAYLNLFVFMMLMLILGDNLLVMFVGWEGVGLCSYLLIGYWYQESANATAGMKAFLANRIGDIGFLIGVFLCFKMFGTVSFTELKLAVLSSTFDAAAFPLLGTMTFCLFVAACGKSAQIPLYVWLPDAMAGPTPVSALIHAATMVTAGIFMMCRLNFVFFLTPDVMQLIAIVGVATALFAASIALVQNDIKKVLAYSTVSQLGFMVMACGVGAFSTGFFHVFTHACFKALLFMGAGSVIVAMHHEQDMREMGGLRRYLPITHAVFLVGVLAIIGFPGFSGFFSKDEILWHAYLGGGWPLWAAAVVAACMTAFYMVRLLCLTFYGNNRSDAHTRDHLHETPVVMWAPLIVLALLSIFAGYLGVPEFIFGEGTNILHHYFADHIIVIPRAAQDTWAFLSEHHSHALEWGLMGASTSAVLLAAGSSFALYKNGPNPRLLLNRPAYDLLLNKYWVDETYDRIFVSPLRDMGAFLYRVFDVIVVDGLVNGLAQAMSLVAAIASFRMTGSLHRHGMVMLLGLLCLLTVLVFS